MTELPMLTYAVTPPAVVRVTIDAAHPVQNTVQFNVANASGRTVTFGNPQGLTPESQLPAMSDATSTLDRLYVWFPWGDDPGDLSTVGDAASIHGSTDADGWTQPVAMSDPTLGRCWILFPRSKTVFLRVNESVEFDFSGIVSMLPAGVAEKLTWVGVQLRMGGASASDSVAIWKRAIDATLAVSKMIAAPGEQVVLTWTTTGIDSCDLDPGAFRGLPANGHQPVSAPSAPGSTEYTLTGYPAGMSPVHTTATVRSVLGWADLGPAPSPTSNRAFLFALGDGFLSLGPGGRATWGSRDGGSWQPRGSYGYVGALPVMSAATDGKNVWIVAPPNAVNSTFYTAWTTAAGGWKTATSSTKQPYACAAAAFRDALWLLGGNVFKGFWSGSAPTSAVACSSDGGLTWSPAPDAPWAPRNWWSAVGAVVFGDALWIVGGQNAAGWCADAWFTLDGKQWTQAPAPPWGASAGLLALAATSDTLYALTVESLAITPPDGSPLKLWQMDSARAWSAASPAPPFVYPAGQATWAFSAPIGMAAYGDGVIVVADHVWQYVPPAATERR